MTTDFAQARLFCFGLGYSAKALAAKLKPRGCAIAGTVRDLDKSESLRGAGYRIFTFERGRWDEALLAALVDSTHLLLSVPPDAEGDPVFNSFAKTISGCRHLRWIGYLSTTGVYGNRDGDWVDEDSALEPTGERGRRRVDAEAAWLQLAREHELPVHIFRLAGIYGPGRNALRTVLDGRARRLDKPGQVFSRIHVEDIAQILEASMAAPHPGRVYNVCDDMAAPPQEVIAHAAELLGIDPPPLVPFDGAELSPMARSFYRDNKRVSNTRIKQELGVTLTYPDYRTGLARLLADEK